MEIRNTIYLNGQPIAASQDDQIWYIRYYDPSTGRYITSDPIGHANPGQIYDDRNDRTGLSPGDLADLIKDETGWDLSTPVHIEGCRAAEDEDSFAEQLSKVLSTQVSGHNAYLIPLPGKPGNYTYSHEIFNLPLFIPGGSGQIKVIGP